MQPSRAFSLRVASTIVALQSTTTPWQVFVLGCPVTSTANSRAATPT